MAEDRDLGENSDITYRFQTASDYFEINSNTGDIKTSRLLEPAAVRVHRLAVIATDGGDPAQSSTGNMSYIYYINGKKLVLVRVSFSYIYL